jgi:hypothetical protein
MVVAERSRLALNAVDTPHYRLQPLGQLLTALLVEDELSAAEVGVVGHEATACGCVVDLLEDLREPRRGHALAHDRGELAPRLVGDVGSGDSAVMMLDRAASLSSSDELDQPELRELPDVVADVL